MTSPSSTSKVGASMINMLAIPTISSTFPDARVMVNPGFDFTVSLCDLHHLFKIRDTTVPVLMHRIPKVQSLVVSAAIAATPIWGWNSESSEVPEISFCRLF